MGDEVSKGREEEKEALERRRAISTHAPGLDSTIPEGLIVLQTSHAWPLCDNFFVKPSQSHGELLLRDPD